MSDQPEASAEEPTEPAAEPEEPEDPAPESTEEPKEVEPTPTPNITPEGKEPSAKTGDTANMFVWMLLAILSAGTMGAMYANKKASAKARSTRNQ